MVELMVALAIVSVLAALSAPAYQRMTCKAKQSEGKANVTRMLSRHVGIGAIVSFSRARVKMPSATDSTLTVYAGGANVGGGIRFRF